jgi:indolepyruvate ferredoxin oxidoreductase, beta subunit
MTRPLRLSIHALGGQGGGVLADWIADTAEHAGWWTQATSVPGVAQRTGATVYYIEIAPPGPEPIFALMPSPGDVDVVIASELMEAGRAVARGLVTPARTTLIASSHRIFAIGEKSAMGDGAFSAAAVLEGCIVSAKRLVLADLDALAAAHGSVISATLLGALAGSGVMPFAREDYEAAIARAGVGVKGSLAAFGAAFDLAAASPAPALAAPRGAVPLPAGAPPLSFAERTAKLPEAAQAYARLGAERLTDYQDKPHAARYLDRVEAVADAERALGGAGALAAAAARHLALWMSYEDVIRVADLKTRASRAARVAGEVRAGKDVLTRTTEFMHPRFEEVIDMLPAGLAQRLQNSARLRRWLTPLIDRDRQVTTSSLSGFLLLWGIARLRRWRPMSLRFKVEEARIEAWLASAVSAARSDLALGVEVIRLQRLVRGYSDTHARGLTNFAAIMRELPALTRRGDGAIQLAGLHRAALADDESRALTAALAALANEAPAIVAAGAEPHTPALAAAE